MLRPDCIGGSMKKYTLLACAAAFAVAGCSTTGGDGVASASAKDWTAPVGKDGNAPFPSTYSPYPGRPTALIGAHAPSQSLTLGTEASGQDCTSQSPKSLKKAGQSKFPSVLVALLQTPFLMPVTATHSMSQSNT